MRESLNMIVYEKFFPDFFFFLSVIGLFWYGVWGGRGGHAKKGVIIKKGTINKIICFHSKTFLLVLKITSLQCL